MVISWFVDEELKFFLSHASGEDLHTIAGLLESGKLRSVIDRDYPLGQAAEAMRYLETGRARGKVIITIGGCTGHRSHAWPLDSSRGAPPNRGPRAGSDRSAGRDAAPVFP